jgi:hypothetical protein
MGDVIMAAYAEEELLKTIWGQRELGLILPFTPAWSPEIMQSSLEYIRKYNYPFLQIINSEAVFTARPKVNFFSMDDGWVIFDYGDAMSVAASHGIDIVLRQEQPQQNDGAEGGSNKKTECYGTVIMQQANAAFALIALAKQKSWSGIELIAGTKDMQRYAWIAAQFSDLVLNNYTPTEDDYKSLERVKMARSQVAQRPIVVHEEVLASKHE